MAQAGYFTDDSMLRRVQRERAVALGTQRTLLMQAAHPVALAGFFNATAALDDIYGRLERTAMVLHAIGFGTREQADRATRRVRAMHRRVRGTLAEPAGRFPAGTAWAADDPPLLLWILATLVDSNLAAYERYVRPLSRDERDAYWQDFRVVGDLFGLDPANAPGTIEAFDDYMTGMLASGDLRISQAMRERALEIVMRPPLPPALLPLREMMGQITISLLPAEVRRLYGFAWDPVREAAVRSGAEYVKRVVVPLLPQRVRYVPGSRAA